jgi:hypothetical protein
MGAALVLGAKTGGIWSGCTACTGVDASEWLLCLDDIHELSLPSKVKGSRRRSKDSTVKGALREVGAQRLEELTKELFQLHDLNGNGALEEIELVKLNEKIAVLHHGKGIDKGEIRSKYRYLFRAKLDPNGQGVPYETFRVYACEMLDGIDTDPVAQEMILEQFVAEALSARQAFSFDLPCLLDQLDTPSLLSSEETGSDDDTLARSAESTLQGDVGATL